MFTSFMFNLGLVVAVLGTASIIILCIGIGHPVIGVELFIALTALGITLATSKSI